MSPKSAFTVQKAQETEPMLGGMSLPITFITELDVAPDWDLHDRDAYLRTFWKRFGNDMLQSVVATGVAKVQTQNWELEGPEKLADMYHHMYRDDADFGRGYDSLISRGVESYYTQDNGWFMERLRSGPKDFDGPMLGIAHMDSARMRATGNDEFPWTYQDVHGEYHLMHRAQFIRIVDMPTPRTELYGMQKGFCALSRVLSTAMILTLIVAMKRERLANLPPSALAIFNNINRKQFDQALSLRTMQEDMSGNMVWRQLLPLFGIDPAHPASVQFLSLREVWESYDDRTAYDISAYSYAAGFRFDPREFWPVSQGPLGTGREAELQHQKAKGKSHGLIFTALERSLNADWSQPKELKFKFVLQDIEEEEQRAAIHSLQITNIKSMQEAGAALTTDEVRYLLATQYKVIPRIMAAVPEEGEEVDLTHADVFMDDVERQAKEYMYFDFGPHVIVDVVGNKTYLPSGKVRHDVYIPGGNGKAVDASKSALVAKLKGDFVCCPSHAAQMFPDVVDALARLKYLTSEQTYMANLVDDAMIGGVVRATKQAVLSGGNVLTAASGELIRQLATSTLVLGTKESQALQTINQKISSLDNITARAIREDAKRLRVVMSSPRRYAALKDIPDEVWEDAVRADALDEQEKAFKGGSGSGNWGHTGRPGMVGGSGGRGGIPADIVARGGRRAGVACASWQRNVDKRGEKFMNDNLPGGDEDWAHYGSKDLDYEEEVVATIADATGMDKVVVAAMAATWMESSADEDINALKLQVAAGNVYGVDVRESLRARIVAYDREYGMAELASTNTERAAFLRQSHAMTQAQLAAAGYKPGDTIRLYRGTTQTYKGTERWAKGSDQPATGNPLQSWTLDYRTANIFGSVPGRDEVGFTLGMDVPIEAIIGTPHSGMGCVGEAEFVILGSQAGQAVRILDRYDYGG